jgi:hypothetical protein
MGDNVTSMACRMLQRDIYFFFCSHMPKRKANRDSDASPSEDSASVSDGSDFESRPRKQAAKGTGKTAAAVKPKASAGPRLKKSTKPEWNRVRTFLILLCCFLVAYLGWLVPRQAGN